MKKEIKDFKHYKEIAKLISKEEKANYKANLHFEKLKKKYSKNNIDIEIVSKDIVASGLKLVLEIKVNGSVVEVNNPFIIINPPLMVPDGTTYDEEINGTLKTLDNYKEDIDLASESVLFRVVETALSRRGVL